MDGILGGEDVECMSLFDGCYDATENDIMMSCLWFQRSGYSDGEE